MEEWVFNEEILNQSKTESKQGKYQILHSVSDGLQDTFTPTSILQQITHSQIISFHFMYLSFTNVWCVCYLHQLGGFPFPVSNCTLSKPFLGVSPAPVLPILSDSLKHQWKNPLPTDS